MKPTVKLTDRDGNAFAIMGAVKNAMKEFSKNNPEYDSFREFKNYQKEATSGDYDNLLQVTMKYCEVE